MTDYGIPRINSSGIVGKVTNTNLKRDPLLEGLSDGDMRFLFDLDFSWCYPGAGSPPRTQGSPTRNQTIYDISERANGTYTSPDIFEYAFLPDYAGGGFDYTDCDRNPWGVKGPTDAWDTIHAATDRYFLWCGYYRMPTQADWKPSGGFLQMFSNAVNNGFYTEPEPLIITQISNQLSAVRQKAISGTRDIITITPTSDHFGKMCQLSYWRDANGQNFRMKSADGEVSASTSVGDETDVDFSGLGPVWGDSRQPNNGAYGSEDAAASNVRCYRGFLEDLNASGRTPLTVVDNDWTRIQERIAKSAAENGGTSTIFV
jgi:hypothetical protein